MSKTVCPPSYGNCRILFIIIEKFEFSKIIIMVSPQGRLKNESTKSWEKVGRIIGKFRLRRDL